MTCARAEEFAIARQSFRRRLADRYSSRSLSRPRAAVGEWLAALDARKSRYLFPSRLRRKPHLSTRQYARIVHRWADRAGLDSSAYGTHSLRRTKPAQIYRRPAICEPCSCCLATRSWRAPCVISGSRLMMLSASRSRSNFSRAQSAALESQGRSPIRGDRVRQPVDVLLARSRWRSPGGAELGRLRPIPPLNSNGSDRW
jgi:hypothetical protein